MLDASSMKQIPLELQSWLIDTGSLTAKLKSYSDNFSVCLLAQKQRQSTVDEEALLGLVDDCSIIEREVQLYCQGQPVIYANSLIPLVSIVDRFDNLNNLGEQPLGEKIFSDPQLERSPLEWTVLTEKHSLFHSAVQNLKVIPTQIYGRRSLFYGTVKPIVISEFFLPAIRVL